MKVLISGHLNVDAKAIKAVRTACQNWFNPADIVVCWHHDALKLLWATKPMPELIIVLGYYEDEYDINAAFALWNMLKAEIIGRPIVMVRIGAEAHPELCDYIQLTSSESFDVLELRGLLHVNECQPTKKEREVTTHV